MENKQSLDYAYYCVFFKLFDCKELSTERQFFVWADKLNQHICSKVILTSKFRSKDMLLWKRSSAFVTTEDENLWISSRPMWFDGPRAPERSLWTPTKILLPRSRKQFGENYTQISKYCL